mmetsp:Transcript_19517/g.27230  ORF Transcript_19517/g.27230 Transcript_19517/m.27230 type:complete len:205 (-) Transcript_19517:84-698(-)
MLTLPRTTVSQQPEKRKILIRSTASYNHLDQLQNVLVAPTPRKLASMPSSPSAKRKSSEHEKIRSLFGEAGLELQTILLQCLGEVSCTEDTGKQQQPPTPVNPIVNLCNASDDEERETTKIPRLVEMERPPSPPLRSSNPIILNSEFARQQEEAIAEEVSRPAPRLCVQPKKLENLKPKKEKTPLRIRSASWPGPLTSFSAGIL